VVSKRHEDDTMPDCEGILIVGAGPVGLSAALELARFGEPVRIIDQKVEPSQYSKAIGINTRTLELLEPSGVTPRLLQQGVRIPGVQFATGQRPLFTIDFSRLPHRYNFMLGLAQSETERILEARLARFGVEVERGVKFEQLRQDADGVIALLSDREGASEARARYLIGADGARSPVRHALKVAFPGTTMHQRWSLADIRLGAALDNPAARVIVRPDSMLFMLRFQDRVYRVASNRPDVLSRLDPALGVEEVLWQSDFRVNHRQAATYSRGRVFLAGDAAHIHSPLGARGMNMGIEDACTLAVCMANDRAQSYSAARHHAGATAIRLIRAQTRLATGSTRSIRMARAEVLPYLLRIGVLHDALLRRMAGLGYATGTCDQPPPARRRSRPTGQARQVPRS
jgi:2-polyprenyl-6-methoxyphenol hydroxylase-like FAD-dependent oxidoreductase